MALSKALYFTALLPPDEIGKKVLQMKLDIKEKYGIKNALKLPAHITILPPFWFETNREEELFELVNVVTGSIMPFKVELKDFGRFGQRVIYIHVVNHEPVKQLHQHLVKTTGQILPASNESSIHPHITIATRDLNKEKFRQVWPDFQKRSFSESFTVNNLIFFRHNGKTWDIYREFPFFKSL